MTSLTAPISERVMSSRTFSIGAFEGSTSGGRLSVDEALFWLEDIRSKARRAQNQLRRLLANPEGKTVRVCRHCHQGADIGV